MRTLADFSEVGLVQRFDNYINGEWVTAQNYVENINPSDISDVIGEFASSSRQLATLAIEAASSAQREWAALSPYRRFEILDWIGTEIIASQEALGRLLAREEGKTVPEAINEVNRAGAFFKYFSSDPLRAKGELLASARSGVSIEVTHEPLGVIGLITPWNFPISIPAWKTAPALAYGNTVILKPAEQAPASAWALAEIISRSEMPNGVFNLVMGYGQEVGSEIVASNKVKGISFTGSRSVGATIGQECAVRGCRFQLEMGGKNPLVILNDADIALAVRAAIEGSFYSAGQRCTASSRLVVEDGIHDEFVSALVASMAELRVGHALDSNTQIGPVVSKEQLDIDLSYLKIGKSEGAETALEGKLLELEHNGFYLSPSLFIETSNDMRINREEIFGPVASVIPAEDYDHALSIANDTVFGLSSGIITSNSKYIDDFKYNSQVGMVVVNGSTAGMDFHAPFTGRNASSYGPPERGNFARDFYTVVKVAYC